MSRFALSLLVLPTLALVSACGDSAFGGAGSAIGDSLLRSDRPPVTREQVEASPYSAILVRAGGGSTAYVVLHSTTGERQSWLGADRAVLVTQRGRLVATYNLPGGQLVDTWLGSSDPLASSVDQLEGAQSWRIVDLQPGDRFGVRLDCVMRVTGRGPIVILERQYDLAAVEETCRTGDNDTVSNRFWVDPRTGFVWKSDQWAAGAGRVRIEVLKP